MELELKKTTLDNYESSGEVTLTQEETTEVIVPDYCPDIARIIAADGKVYIHSRELRDGKATDHSTVYPGWGERHPHLGVCYAVQC